MSYLFAAYAVFWGASFVFLLTMSSKLRQLEQQIQALKRALQKGQ